MAKQREERSVTRYLRAIEERHPDVAPAIRMREVVQWRTKDGRFARPRTPGATRRSFLAQVDRRGVILDVLEETAKRQIIRTVLPPLVESPVIEAPEGKTYQGMIVHALAQTNALSSTKHAKRIGITVTYRNPVTKERGAFKLDIGALDEKGQTQKMHTLQQYMIGGILDKMRSLGIRTQYPLQMVDWSRVKDMVRTTAKGGRVNLTGKTQVGRRTVVDQVRITVAIDK